MNNPAEKLKIQGLSQVLLGLSCQDNSLFNQIHKYLPHAIFYASGSLKKIRALKHLEMSQSFLVFILISVFLKPMAIEDIFLLNLLFNGSNEQLAEKLIKLVQGYL